jgi:hypothetical protein
MARDFVAVDRGQLLLMPPSLTEWLPEDHLVWTVLGAVEVMVGPMFEATMRELSEQGVTETGSGAC